ncbi:MAG: hypothetical protein ABEJ42_01950 [Halobacteriaceae archaeon]
MRSRLLTAVVGVTASLAITAVAWLVFDQPFVLLVVPFLPVLFLQRGDKGPPERTCPTCSFSTRDRAVRYCPRDGSRLPEPTDADVE